MCQYSAANPHLRAACANGVPSPSVGDPSAEADESVHFGRGRRCSVGRPGGRKRLTFSFDREAATARGRQCYRRRIKPDFPLGWEAMRILDAFPVRPLHSLSFVAISFLLCAAFLSVPASAQHGGGGGGHGGFGGHSGGGHSEGHSGGRSHSSGEAHPGGHFRWMKLGFGRHSTRMASDEVPERMNDWTSSSWSFNTPGLAASSHRLPSTMIWSPARPEPEAGHGISFSSASPHILHSHYFRHHPFFPSSACFFNGISQVCFFEPVLPLLGYGDFGFQDDIDVTDSEPDSAGLPQEEMTGISAPPAPFEQSPPDTRENSVGSLEAPHGASEDWDLGNDVYVLVLQNGTTHPVSSYWLVDGYLEYVSPDGTRSHIPLNALDLPGTVARNESRGIPFVLRSTPTGNR